MALTIYPDELVKIVADEIASNKGSMSMSHFFCSLSLVRNVLFCKRSFTNYLPKKSH